MKQPPRSLRSLPPGARQCLGRPGGTDMTEPIVENVVTRFGRQTVHDGVSFSVARGELIGLIGGSGTGKSVLLREIIGLMRDPAPARSACSGPTSRRLRPPNSPRSGGASA